jgi:hypothetical protein
MNQISPAAGVSSAAMESLARELGVTLEQVETVFRREIERLGAQARIKSFLPVLVTRQVRSEFRRQQLGDPGPGTPDPDH